MKLREATECGHYRTRELRDATDWLDFDREFGTIRISRPVPGDRCRLPEAQALAPTGSSLARGCGVRLVYSSPHCLRPASGTLSAWPFGVRWYS
jgi:hypothetical protein